MTKYYRYGEMDSCERFWDAFYAAMDRNNNTNTTNGSKTAAKEGTKTIRATTSDKVDADDGIAPIGGTWNWKRRRREDERERNAFERAWEVVDPAVAKASWTRRYEHVLFDDPAVVAADSGADSGDKVG